MKIPFLSTTTAIACLASSTEAQIGTRRNLIDSSIVEETIVISPSTRSTAVKDTNSVGGVATSTATVTTSLQTQDATKEQHLEAEQQTEQPIPLPSFDKVMHKDAPSHGMYAKIGQTRSFCARHNHFGPNSGCEQHHASLRGRQIDGRKDATTNSGKKDSPSYLQQHVPEAHLQDQNEVNNYKRNKKQDQYFDRK